MADLAGSYLAGIRSGQGLGESLTQPFVQNYERAKTFSLMMQQKAQEVAAQKEQLRYERAKDAPLTDAQVADLTAGKIPTGPGVTKAMQLGVYEKNRAADLNDVPVNDATNAIYDKAGVPRPKTKTVNAKEYAPVQKLAEINMSASVKPKNTVKLTPEDINNNPFWKKTGHTAGEEVKDSLYASQNKPTGAGVVNLTPKQNEDLKWAVENKLATPSELSARGPRSAIIADIMGDMRSGKIQKGDLLFDVEGKMSGTKAGSAAGATLNAGGDAQKSARAASTVKELLPGLQKASDEYSRANVRFANKAINALDEQSGTGAMTLKQYLTDTKSKMNTALQGGGASKESAQAAIDEAFPATITAQQIPKAIKNIEDIMNTQIKGALTPVTTGPQDKGSGDLFDDVSKGKF